MTNPITLTTKTDQPPREHTWELYWFHRSDPDASSRADESTLEQAGFVRASRLAAAEHGLQSLVEEAEERANGLARQLHVERGRVAAAEATVEDAREYVRVQRLSLSYFTAEKVRAQRELGDRILASRPAAPVVADHATTDDEQASKEGSAGVGPFEAGYTHAEEVRIHRQRIKVLETQLAEAKVELQRQADLHDVLDASSNARVAVIEAKLEATEAALRRERDARENDDHIDAQNHATEYVVAKLNKILDGEKRAGRFGGESLEKLAQRLEAAEAERQHLQEAARLMRECLDPAYDGDGPAIRRIAQEQKAWLDRDQKRAAPVDLPSGFSESPRLTRHDQETRPGSEGDPSPLQERGEAIEGDRGAGLGVAGADRGSAGTPGEAGRGGGASGAARAHFAALAEKVGAPEVSVLTTTDARKAVLVDGCSCSAERYEECAGHAPECDLALLNQRMKLCPDCGNKRCPKAEDPEFLCTGSNELGQAGVRAVVADSATTAEPAPWVRCRQLALNHPERCILREGHEGAHMVCGQPCPLLGDYCPDCGVNGTEPPAVEPTPPVYQALTLADIDKRIAELARAAEASALKGGCHHATQAALAELARAGKA